MILLRSSVLVILAWCAGAAPLSSTSSTVPPSPSSTTANTTTRVFNASTVGHLPVVLPPTIKEQLNQTLANLSAGAVGRWVTAEPISVTGLGGEDPIQSNADFFSLVDQAFADDPSKSAVEGSWVDTYIKFLIKAGSPNITQTQESALISKYKESLTAFSTAQVKLVRAYEEANPDNVTYVGVNIWNVSQIDPLFLNVIEQWGAPGNGSYSKNDFSGYVKLNKTLSDVRAQYMELTQEIQIALDGYQLRMTLDSELQIFNLSMVAGGDPSSMVRVTPAWEATIINNAIISSSALKQLPANFTNNGTSTTSVIFQPSSSSEALAVRATAAHTRPTKPQKKGRGFSPVKAVAKNKKITKHSPHIPNASAKYTSTPSSSSSGAISSSMASSDPLGGISDTLKGNLMVFTRKLGQQSCVQRGFCF